MKPGRRNSNDAVLKRRTTVSEMYLAGRTQYQISLVVNVTPQQVSQDLKRVREHWRSSTLQNFEQKVDIEIAKADQVEQEAWIAYENSRGKHVTVLNRAGEHGAETITKTEYLTGDPSYLSTILRCIDIRCKILGLLAPTKVKTGVDLDALEKLIEARRRKLQT